MGARRPRARARNFFRPDASLIPAARDNSARILGFLGLEFSQAFFKRKAAACLQILQRLRVHRVEFSRRRVRFHLPVPVVVLVEAHQFGHQLGALFERQFFNGFPDFGDWDRQMKADAAAGKFDAMNRDAEADCRAGQTRSLEEILRG